MTSLKVVVNPKLLFQNSDASVALTILLWDPHQCVPRGHQCLCVLDMGNDFMANGGVFDEAATAIRDTSRLWR